MSYIINETATNYRADVGTLLALAEHLYALEIEMGEDLRAPERAAQSRVFRAIHATLTDRIRHSITEEV